VSYIIETLSDGIIIAISAVKATHEPLKEKGSLIAFLLDNLTTQHDRMRGTLS
jgi:hypothetical protein